MNEDTKTAAAGAVTKTCLSIFGWIASITLADVQTIVAILSGLVVMGYALTQWYFLLRDRSKK